MDGANRTRRDPLPGLAARDRPPPPLPVPLLSLRHQDLMNKLRRETGGATFSYGLT